MDPQEIRQKGDKFGLLFIFVFLFIRLGIIGPSQGAPPAPSPAEQAASKAQSRIERIMRLSGDPLDDKLETEGRNNPEQKIPHEKSAAAEPVAVVAASKGSEPPGDAPAGPSLGGHAAESASSSELEVLTKLLEFDLKYLELEKEKIKKGKTYSLPLVNVDIDEETIFLLFPVFTFLGLLGMLKFRWDLLRSTDELLSDVPLWALPISFQRTERKFGEWIFWNSVGLTFHLLVLYTIYDFAFSLQNRDSYSIETTAINVLFLMITLTAYALSLVGAIRHDLKHQSGKAH